MLKKITFLLSFVLSCLNTFVQVNPNAWSDLDFKKEDFGKLKQICFAELKTGVLMDSIVNEGIARVDRCGGTVIFSTLGANTQNLFFGETVYLEWFLNPMMPYRQSNYAVQVTNLDGDIFFKTVQKDSFFVVQLQAQEFKTLPELFIIMVIPLDKKGNEFGVNHCEGWACKRVSEESQRQIQKAMELIEQEAESLDLLTKQYLKVRFFAKYKLGIDAISHFQQALRLAKGAQKATLEKLYQSVLDKM